ncbi:ABC transporter substrate-binding protein [Methylocella tundrae]|uniref:ABC transporter substrate-binding protein n=1 Tax=Methylocella tundrae TaxID=227605 RepID=A0A8B6MAE7_METTU|nr:ABC transporter substrate-binding protein [Methylocella tundrae]VTZ28080.1 ABC transporter substrate-binding protein [Methylocella tundrae]VTZ51884.1 ABC transporter substrate-binding protein [Methylocella tundrae]
MAIFRGSRKAWFALAAALLAAFLAAPATAREIVDMTGRRVVLPERVERVYATAPPVALVVYAVDPKTLLGWNFPPYLPRPGDRARFIAPDARDLPVLGNMMGHGQQTGLEALLALKPDIVVGWANTFLEGAPLEKRFAEAGVPLVLMKIDTLADYPKAFALMGEILSAPARAGALAGYVSAALARLDAHVAALKPPRVKVYYAESPDGLATDCDLSIHAEAIRRAGGENVYHCKQAELVGLEHVSLEEIISWAPDVIVTAEEAFAGRAAADPRWRAVKAAGDGGIVRVPRLPFNWIDRPPGYMQALGAQFLAHRFYPDAFPLDVRDETKKFYGLFFNVDLDDADLDRLLN